MEHNTVTATELTDYVATIESEVAENYGDGYHASIKFNVGHGMYHVYDHRALILSTTSAEDAADAYNAIRPRSVGGLVTEY